MEEKESALSYLVEDAETTVRLESIESTSKYITLRNKQTEWFQVEFVVTTEHWLHGGNYLSRTTHELAHS